MSSENKPYELNRWDLTNPPTPGFFDRWLAKSGLTAVSETLKDGPKTDEMLYPEKTVYIVLSGILQCALPGYGVFDLNAGDQLEIDPNTRHDLKAEGFRDVHYLRAFPQSQH